MPLFLFGRLFGLEDIGSTGIDGMTAFVDSRQTMAAARRIHAPLVNISSGFATQPFCRGRLDGKQDGRLAAEYFLGKRSYGYGFPGAHGHWG